MLLDMNDLKENFYKTNMFVNKFIIITDMDFLVSCSVFSEAVNNLSYI